MAKDKYLMVYCVKYANFFDDEKFFEKQGDAKQCEEADRKKHALEPEDQLLGVVPVRVWRQYNPEKYGHEKIE